MAERPRDELLGYLSQYYHPQRLRDSFYSLTTRTVIYFRYSREHERDQYFFGVVKAHISEFDPAILHLAFICGTSGKVIVLPASAYFAMHEDVAPHSDGQWKATIRQVDGKWWFRINTKEQTGHYDVTPFLNNFEFTAPTLRSAKPTVPAFETLPERRRAKKSEVTEGTEAQPIWEALAVAARDSRHPARLEQCVEDAFTALGFDAQRLAHAGQTDVVIRNPYRVVVDCKSTSTASLGSVNFARIRRHMEAQGAKNAAIVGPRFAPALIRDAEAEGFSMIEAGLLAELTRLASLYPPSPQDLLPLFQTRGLVSAEVIAACQAGMVAADMLHKAAFQLLDTLDFAPRSLDEIRGRLSGAGAELADSAVSAALDWLRSPLVAAVNSSDGHFRLALSREAARSRMRHLGTQLQLLSAV